MQAGLLPNADEAVIDVNRSASMTVNGASVPASVVTIDYPFTFMFLQPIARLVNPDSGMSGAVTMRAQALMRNE
jgi:hypothetical protein